MSEQINEYVRSHNILYSVKSRFVKGSTTPSTLTDVVENLRADLDNNMIFISVLLDHSKNFVKVDHFILLKKLEKLFCFLETACRLLRSYSTGRSQIISYNGTCSESLDVNRGVP